MDGGKTFWGYPASVLLVDRRPVVMRGFRNLIEKHPNLEVTGEASCLGSALAAFSELEPDVAIVCHCPPALDALELIRRVRLARLDARIALFAADAGEKEVLAALRLDIDGLLPEEMTEDDLLACLEALSERGKWISSAVLSRTFDGPLDLPGTTGRELPALTERQREISHLVAQGLSNKGIAHALTLSESTVKLHLNRIFRRLGVTNRASLAAAVTML